MKKLFTFLTIFLLNFAINAQNTSNDTSESQAYLSLTEKLIESSKKKKNKKEEKDNKIKTIVSTQKSEYLVELPIYVSDKQLNPVINLKKEHFTLFIDGEKQEVETLKPVDQEYNRVILLVDVSGSASVDKLKEVQEFSRKIINKLSPNTNVKIVSFSDKYKILCDFTNDKLKLIESLRKLSYGGGTAFYDTLINIGKNDGKENTKVIILTDGVDTTSKNSFQAGLDAIEMSRLIVFTVYLDTFGSIIDIGKTSPMVSAPVGLNIPYNNQQAKWDYDLGKHFLNDLAVVSSGKVFNNKGLASLKDDDIDFLLKYIEPQYNLVFRKIASTIDKNSQIKIMVNEPNLLIRSRALINLKAFNISN